MVEGTEKNYSLRWEKHASNLATEAGYFFEDESFLDCTLSAEGQMIQAHKIILSASSTYFAGLLKISSEKHPILIFNDMTFEQLRTLVTFIYTGSANVAQENIHSFLALAQSLQIKGLYENDSGQVLKNYEEMRKSRLEEINKSVSKKPFIKNKLNKEQSPSGYQGGTPKTSPTHNTRTDSMLKRQPSPEYAECEKSLSKLQEITFTKYLPENETSRVEQNVKHSPVRRSSGSRTEEVLTNGDVSKKMKLTNDNYVVKSWTHNSVDDISKHKLKNGLTNKWRSNHEGGGHGENTDRNKFWNDLISKKTDEKDEPISANLDSIVSVGLVEPKKEPVEPVEEYNCDRYESEGEEQSSDVISNHTDNYYQHNMVERGMPVPVLMCKPTLSEPESAEPSPWPPVPGALDNRNEVTTSDSCELPCPTCCKKYKSRYALNRHMLYECGKARKSFSCDECGKKVTRQDTLQKHKLIHLVQHMKEKDCGVGVPAVASLLPDRKIKK